MNKQEEKSESSKMILDSFRNELSILVSKSQDDFEKLIIYLSAGAITISLPLIQFIVGKLSDAHYKLFIFIGWTLLISTLLVNLYSHFYTIKQHRKTIEEIENGLYSRAKAVERNKSIDNLNLLAFFLLILGVILVLAFITINILRNDLQPR